MKRVAIVSETLGEGGVVKALLTMLNMLDYSKYEVTLYLPSEDGMMQTRIDPHVKVRRWSEADAIDYSKFLKMLLLKRRMKDIGISVYYRFLAHKYKNNLQKNIHYSFKSCLFDRTNENNDYDLVIVNQGLNRYHMLFSRKSIKAKRYICWIHGIDYASDDEDREALSEIYSWFDSFVCVSNAVEKHFKEHLLRSEKKTTVIYNLFDIQGIRKAAEQPIEERMDSLSFVTVGRLSYEKGQRMIPFIAKELLESGYRFQWFVVGDGDDREILEKEIEELSLADTVILTGAKENPYPYMKKCDLYIQPSYAEGFCLSTYEAKILRKHVVVTKVPGMSEQFAEGEAVFADPDVPSLVEAIKLALKTIHLPVKYKDDVQEFNMLQLEKINHLLCGE